ncbi:vacuolar protein-sorting protein bro1-like [Dorcoceras hygrometricum]|uniref:Vacuolar protein-sorting protein bro1-like n=1 Tax=Dorcoceras hygrometricum TaxID=472368 RepID=A0A2Z7AT00_9LAMI|nr:vacuolar protein-sorting protein bro1-like [Dorcoceras hygrometricum]
MGVDSDQKRAVADQLRIEEESTVADQLRTEESPVAEQLRARSDEMCIRGDVRAGTRSVDFGENWQQQVTVARAGHDIVASFILNKPAPFLEDHISQLEDDIFEEMSFTTTKVQVISLESSAGSNITKVVFSVESDVTTQSLIRASFVYLITRQSSLHLTESLFGDPSSFNVLKFRGGITVSPEQKAFLLQKVQILFNFTLNFSIDQLLMNFDELTSQLNKGLQLSPYENLYIKLTNLKGSTVAPPTTVQSQVLLAVGINPSNSRLKQLAQTITGSHSKNLGLNNTVFGRVKQIQLSSILQHSLGNDGNSPSPSPAPSPLSRFPYRYPHHRHGATLIPVIAPSPSPRNGGYRNGKRSPTSAPVPPPVPGKKKAAEPPACHFRYRNWFPWKHNKHSGIAPSTQPAHAPHAASPKPMQEDPVTPRPNPVSASSPLPNVGSAHSQPPSKGEFHGRQQNAMPLFSPSPSPCEYILFPRELAAHVQMFTIMLHQIGVKSWIGILHICVFFYLL